MARTNAAESEFYYCHSLSDIDGRDERDIREFTPVDERGSGLVWYLQRRALTDELLGTMRTYLVRDNLTGGLVGYFSLKAGLVSINEERGEGAAEFGTIPGVELANFAMNKTFRNSHEHAKGCGGVVFRRLVLPLVERAAQVVGVAALYIFSLP